jgi:hypothetical protein
MDLPISSSPANGVGTRRTRAVTHVGVDDGGDEQE